MSGKRTRTKRRVICRMEHRSMAHRNTEVTEHGGRRTTTAKWTEMRGESTLTMRTEHEHGGRDGAWNTEGPMRMSRGARCLNVMEDQYQHSAEWWRMTVDMESTRFRDQKDPDPYNGSGCNSGAIGHDMEG